MNDKNKGICERFEKLINSDLVVELLKNNNISIRDIVKAQDNFNSKIMNFLYVYLKLIDTNEFIIEDLKFFTEFCNTLQNESLNFIISKVTIARMQKIGMDEINIKNKILNELLHNRLYLHCTYEQNAKNIVEASNEELDTNLDTIISIFSMYGKGYLFKYARFDNGLFYYAGNFDYAATYCYTAPEWLYLLLGEAYVCRDKEAAFHKLNNCINNFDSDNNDFDSYNKKYIIDYFEKIWDYYNKVSNTPNILFFEGNNVDDKISFYWDSNESETNNLINLLDAISYINNRSTNKKIDNKLFKRISLPTLDKIINLNKQQIIKR